VTTPATFEKTPWPKTTERLTLRPGTPDDLPGIFAYRTQAEVAEWMPSRPEHYVEFVMRVGRSDVLSRTLVIEVDDRLVGDLYVHVEDAWAQSEVAEQGKAVHAEIGWCLDPAHQGKGYATEGMRELLRVCFDDLGVRRVTAVAFAENAPSLAVMERLGMRRESLAIADALHRDRGWVDSVTYALLADEWRARQA
jgi:RimJ/RimL family protein N-acetyltransferase